MKQLLLIRHAKSSWNHLGLTDHDRPLNKRGEGDALKIAAALKQRGVAPDIMLSSTALRAATTAQMLAEGLGFPVDAIRYDSDMYLASPETLLGVIQQLDESAGTALLFGHNPGMHDTVNRLANDFGADEFPTLAVARFEIDVDYWGEVSWNSGLLIELLTPATLKNG